ncbi:MAG: hypothetical protein NTX45_01595 [Proteobacteria bacterium]|nr:hypothetical protein [Pseudomonadota bacterium]
MAGAGAREDAPPSSAHQRHCVLKLPQLLLALGFDVLTALHYQRNRPYLHLLIFVLLASWVSMLVSATCSMPGSWRVSSTDVTPAGCQGSDSHAAKHQGHTVKLVQDCSLKPCPDSQPNPLFGFKIDQPDVPVIVLCLAWLIGHLLNDSMGRRVPCPTAPPDGRRVPLIFRFCTLLN